MSTQLSSFTNNKVTMKSLNNVGDGNIRPTPWNKLGSLRLDDDDAVDNVG